MHSIQHDLLDFYLDLYTIKVKAEKRQDFKAIASLKKKYPKVFTAANEQQLLKMIKLKDFKFEDELKAIFNEFDIFPKLKCSLN